MYVLLLYVFTPVAIKLIYVYIYIYLLICNLISPLKTNIISPEDSPQLKLVETNSTFSLRTIYIQYTYIIYIYIYIYILSLCMYTYTYVCIPMSISYIIDMYLSMYVYLYLCIPMYTYIHLCGISIVHKRVLNYHIYR